MNFPLSEKKLEKDILKKDKREALRIGAIGIGAKALYLNSFYIDRMYYIPIEAVERVYKRVAMSKGGFSGKGIFASLSYLVVEYDGGKEKACLIRKEWRVDEVLSEIRKRFPAIPTMSKRAEEKLRAEEAEEKAKLLPKLSEEAEGALSEIEKAEAILLRREDLYQNLAVQAKRERMVQSTNPYYGHFALLLFLGAVLCLFSAFFLYKNREQSLAIVLLGFALMLLMMGLRVRPTGKNNREAVKKEYEESIRKMKDYLSGDFPLPPQYGHPLCLEWMRQSVLEGKATTVREAYFLLKKELKELDSTKQVSQKVYDRIIIIKPMFLAAEYQD
jgi:hypothetical protein